MHNKILFMTLFVFSLGQVYATQQQVTTSEIKKSLACQCACSMTVEACQGSMTCQSADNLTEEADGFIQQGMNKADILGAFIKKYGESILAAPTKKGFNLVAWILPFAAILLAGFAIVVILRRWVNHQKNSETGEKFKISDKKVQESPYEKKLDEALRFLD